jgi:hypothetical protein
VGRGDDDTNDIVAGSGDEEAFEGSIAVFEGDRNEVLVALSHGVSSRAAALCRG